MPDFGDRSEANLQTCDTRIVSILREVIKTFDFAVIQGHRGKKEQDEAYHSGRSKVKFPNSKHNAEPSLAVDIVPYPIDWNDTGRFYYLAGMVMHEAHRQGVKLRWGGDWDRNIGGHNSNDQSFMDLPHFEIWEG